MSPHRRLLKESLRESAEDILTPEGLDRLAARLATKRLVLLGEASHGTADFYRVRRELSQRLIERHGFAGIVAEADWPDALRLTRYARDESEDASADEALETFQRFPTWMWRNTEVRQLLRWMRSFNASPQGTGVGFYGMDLYSLHLSMREVIHYLQGVEPAAAALAQERYACFDRFGDDAHQYGRATAHGEEACEDQAVQQLLELQQRRLEVLTGTGADERFYAEQNARLVQNAERYYRSMFRGRASSWNLRDTHMADTVDALLEHLGNSWAPPRLILWAHNSHLGDASATDMARLGEVNVGQLLRQRHPGEVALVGLTTYEGTVTAAHDWDDHAQRMTVRPALAGSVEELLHETGLPSFAFSLQDLREGLVALKEPRLERFIGVIYRPLTERQSHYFEARLADQFDHLIHLDYTRALQPLAREPAWAGDEPPETFPSAM